MLKFNRERLDQIISGNNISQYEKELIKECAKKVLFRPEECSDYIYQYLEDLQILSCQVMKEENLQYQESPDEDCIDKIYIDLVQSTFVTTSTWNYNDYNKYNILFKSEQEWIQTLTSKINNINAHIHKQNKYGGADCIVIGQQFELKNIIKKLDFFKENPQHNENAIVKKIGSMSKYEIFEDRRININNYIVVGKRDNCNRIKFHGYIIVNT